MEFSRPEYQWVAIPFSRGLPNPGTEPRSPTLQLDSLQPEPLWKPYKDCECLEIENEILRD